MIWLFRTVILAALCLGALASCDNSKPAASPSANATTAADDQPRVTPFGHLDRAQPRLPTMKLWLGDKELVTELALTPVAVQTGMMFRTNMPANEGMLFVFSYPDRKAFYMKNTTVPLSAAYIDPKGAILEIHDLQPLNEQSVVAESDQVQFVLEVNQGWFKQHNIGPGTVIRTERGSLQDTFLRNR